MPKSTRKSQPATSAPQVKGAARHKSGYRKAKDKDSTYDHILGDGCSQAPYIKRIADSMKGIKRRKLRMGKTAQMALDGVVNDFLCVIVQNALTLKGGRSTIRLRDLQGALSTAFVDDELIQDCHAKGQEACDAARAEKEARPKSKKTKSKPKSKTN